MGNIDDVGKGVGGGFEEKRKRGDSKSTEMPDVLKSQHIKFSLKNVNL